MRMQRRQYWYELLLQRMDGYGYGYGYGSCTAVATQESPW